MSSLVSYMTSKGYEFQNSHFFISFVVLKAT